MKYKMGVFIPVGRENTAQAALRLHFMRVAEESGAKFGELRFTVFPAALCDPSAAVDPRMAVFPFFVLAEAEIDEPPQREAGPCSAMEIALLESLVSVLQ